MQFLSIDVKECAEDIIGHISKELQQLNKIAYNIENEEDEDGSSIVCKIGDEIHVDSKSSSYYLLILHVSNALADYIIRRYEEKLMTRIISGNYCYFNSLEKKEILKFAINIIRNDDKNFFNSLFKIRRRNIIVNKLIDYFESSNKLILDGFVNFRLKEYIKDLEEVVDRAVDDFLMDREYKEFIRLLRYFVDIQEPKFNVINVLIDYTNKYILFDEKGKEITNECVKEFVNEISEGEINYDDLLVSSLITLAPRKIVIHGSDNFKNKELLETIKNVFTSTVSICSGCKLCAGFMVNNKN